MPLSIRLPEDIETRLKVLAKRTGRSKTYYVTEAVIEHLQDLEDVYFAERELESVRTGKSETISLLEAMKQHGMGRSAFGSGAKRTEQA